MMKKTKTADSPASAKTASTATSSRMGSIARKINFDFWVQQFIHFILLDLVLTAVAVATFIFFAESQITEGVINRYTDGGETLASWYYYAETAVQTYKFPVKPFIMFLKYPAAAIGIAKLGLLINAAFSTKGIRKHMKPLQDIAIKTEELSSMSYGQVGQVGQAGPVGQNGRSGQVRSANLETMEEAIENLNPDLPGAKVVTGDKELQSLEIAINNLLERMRESRRQQERFVSDASHELRTPIAVIEGYVNMLDRWGKDDEQILKESIEALKNESAHMKSLVEQLLFLARGDSGRNTLEFKEFNLIEMVRDVMEESSMIDDKHVYRFEQAGARAKTDGSNVAGVNNTEGINAYPVTVTGDMAMLKQSLRIFVQNAAKYSGEGDTITLKAGRDVDGKAFFSVQDEGVGMKSSEVVHVFERFYRSDSARNSTQGGTGLGLSIAKWIVDAHGGVIEILTRPEFGTRIMVKL